MCKGCGVRKARTLSKKARAKGYVPAYCTKCYFADDQKAAGLGYSRTRGFVAKEDSE